MNPLVAFGAMLHESGLDPDILGPAFAAGLIVLLTHVPLGRRVLARGIIFIDLAIAQMAGLGVILAGVWGGGFVEDGILVQAAALGAALLGAFFLYGIERRLGGGRPGVQEAVIGATFVLAATAAILLLAHNPHGGEHLKDLLAGQILWVDYPRLAVPLAVSLAVVFIWSFPRARDSASAFYVLFAISVTTTVQLVGVYLVFASLILPALGTRTFSERVPFVAFLMGMCGYGLGLVLSTVLDLSAGPMIVWTLALFSLGGLFHRPRMESEAEPEEGKG
uniref:Zinc/manganese transport system permease protein n=1 Tax=Candidatus Kentrum sp. DK TaxID=2126562 RepID=A0A450T3R1_9GAMM|nr:MAG: zinc/manganese transport system permease protein [Candidatus Kentron sp. DK]